MITNSYPREVVLICEVKVYQARNTSSPQPVHDPTYRYREARLAPNLPQHLHHVNPQPITFTFIDYLAGTAYNEQITFPFTDNFTFTFTFTHFFLTLEWKSHFHLFLGKLETLWQLFW